MRKEQERLEGIKKKEVARIANERRRENERRRTQEIKFNREDFEQIRAGHVNGKSEASKSSSVASPTEEAFKRGESLRLEPQKHKRTPSFTTRRRTQSFRRHTKNLNTVQNLPPVEVDGYLDRKQELQTGGKRATIRSWKPYYTVLCGQLMCFFKDQEDFFESKAASPPLMIFQASVQTADDYTKRKFVFRLHTSDGSEFLFGADNEEQQQEWVKKIKFHATLPPSQQLTQYRDFDETKENEFTPPAPPTNGTQTNATSEPVYANVPTTNDHSPPARSPPLPESQPPPSWVGQGASGTRQILKQSSRHSLQSQDSGPVYANVNTAEVPDGRHLNSRSNTLPSHRSSDGDSFDNVSSSSKVKKSSVLGRFLGRKNK